MSGGAGYDGLIDPAQFPFRSEEMDVGALEAAAGVVRGLGAGVSGGAEALVASWSGLRPVYEGPGQERVWGLMEPVAAAAGRLAADMSTAADHLEHLAEAFGRLRGRLADLEERAGQFRARVVDGVRAWVTESGGEVVTLGVGWVTIPWYQDTDTVAENEGLLLEHARLVAQISAASADSHNALMDLVRWAGEEHDVAGVQAEQLMDRRVEYPWGTPVAEERNWGESVAHGAYSFAYNLAAGVVGLGFGYDLRMGESNGQARAGFVDAWLSAGAAGLWALLAIANPGLGRLVHSRLSPEQQQWLQERQLVAAAAVGDLVGLDMQAHASGDDGLWRWREDAIATGTESALNIGSMFAPSGGAAAGAARTGASAPDCCGSPPGPATSSSPVPAPRPTAPSAWSLVSRRRSPASTRCLLSIRAAPGSRCTRSTALIPTRSFSTVRSVMSCSVARHEPAPGRTLWSTVSTSRTTPPHRRISRRSWSIGTLARRRSQCSGRRATCWTLPATKGAGTSGMQMRRSWFSMRFAMDGRRYSD